MKNYIVLFLCIMFVTPTSTRSQSPDVVAALQPIQNLLKAMLKQESMDFNVYEKMENYQKSLNAVYQVTEAIEGMQTYIEIIKLLEEFACSIRGLDELLNKPNFDIPFNSNDSSAESCMFKFKYQNVLTSFSLANDMVGMIVSPLQLTVGERMSVMESGFNELNKAFSLVQELRRDIIYYNL